MNYFIVIFAALCVCDYLALLVYSIKYVPTGLSEASCYPFFVPCKMQIALVVRVIQLAAIIFGAIVLKSLSAEWILGLSIGTGVFALVYCIVFCSLSY